MSQHDMNIANAAGAALRADMNLAIAALVSNSSGATEPSTMFAYQWWADTTSGLLKLRNAANSAWITVGTLASTNLGFAPVSGATLTGALLAAVGLVSAPGVAFDGDSDTGFYWISSNTWGLVSGGTEYLRISPTGITFLGTGATTLPSGTTAQRPGSPVNGMIRLNTDLSAVDVYINGWLTIPNVTAYPFATADIANTTELCPLMPFDFSNFGASAPLYPQFPWSSPTKLTNPTSLPAGNGQSVDCTPNSEYVAVGHTTTPFVTIYKRKGTELVKLANPATLPASDGLDCAFSLDGQFLAVAHATTPFITVYQRTEGTDTWTKLTNPVTLPAGAGGGCAWCPNGEFLAVGHTTTPFVTIYQRSGTTLTKLTNPGTLPAGNASAVAWSSDGQFLFVGHSTTPFITIYQRTGGVTFTKLSNPASLPPAAVVGVAMTNDMNYLACVHSTSPYVTVYSRSGTTFTKMVAGNASQFADSADYPAGIATRVSFSLNGSYMAVSHNTTPFITVYLLTSGKWVKQADPGTLPAGVGTGVKFQFEREFLLVSHQTTPFVTVYQTASDMPATSVGIIKKINRAGT